MHDLRDTPEGIIVTVGRRTATLASLISAGLGEIGFGDIVALGFPKPTYEMWGYYTYPTSTSSYRVYHGLGGYDFSATLLRRCWLT